MSYAPSQGQRVHNVHPSPTQTLFKPLGKLIGIHKCYGIVQGRGEPSKNLNDGFTTGGGWRRRPAQSALAVLQQKCF